MLLSILTGILYGIFAALGADSSRGIADAIGIVLAISYFAYFEGGPTGQTIGKRIMGIRVVRFATGGPLGYGLGIGRYFSRILSSIVCFLGYFWALWDREKQCWHDKICSTVVVPVDAYPVSR